MAKRDWLIKPSWLGMIALIIAAYSCIAIWRGGIITYWQPGKIDFGNLLFDIFGLWWLLCLAAGVLAHRQPCSANARYWPILLVSFVLTTLVSANLCWNSINLLRWNSQAPITLRFGLPIGAVLMPIVPTLAIWSLARFSRRLRQTDVCVQCGYNLTGNASGRCPECGRLKDASPSKRLTADTRWLPELNLFETVAQRDEAWQFVRRNIVKDPRTWIHLSPWLAFVVLCCTREWMHRPAWGWWWPAQILLGMLILLDVWWSHQLVLSWFSLKWRTSLPELHLSGRPSPGIESCFLSPGSRLRREGFSA